MGTDERGGARPVRRLVIGALLVGLLVVGVLGAFTAVEALTARDALQDARRATAQGASALGGGDLDEARERFAAAESRIELAERRTTGVGWAVTTRTPLIGRSAHILRDAVAVARGAVTVGRAAVEEGAALFDDDGGLALRIEDGVVDLASVSDAARSIAALPVADLAAARDRLEARPTTWVPEQVREGRREGLALAGDALRTLEAAEAVLGVLPAFLGEDGPRHYFLGMQTSAEIRGTGGLIGYYTILTVDDGAFSLGDPTAIDEIEEDGDGRQDVQRPGRVIGSVHENIVDAPPGFLARYGHASAAGYFSNVNLHPDLPTTSEVLLSLYTHYTGDELDGVILTDPVGMGLLLRAGEPVEVPDEVRDADGLIPEAVAAADIPRLLLADIYEIYGHGRKAERLDFFEEFAHAAFDQVFSASWDPLALGEDLGRAIAGRHVQVFSTDPEVGTVFAELGVAGALVNGQTPGDVLAVTANNAVGGKMDVHLQHRLSGEFHLELDERPARGAVRPATRTGALRVTVDNPLPSDGMDLYIIGNCLEGSCFDGPPGWNRTWFTVWAANRTELRGTDGSDEPRRVRRTEMHGLRGIDRFLESPPEGTGWFEMDLASPVELRREGPDLVYRLHLWRQAKAVPDHLDLTIVAPDEWSVVDAGLEGGGEPVVAGFDDRGERLAVSAEDERTVRVSGAMTADTVIEIRFTRPLLDRFLTWVQEPAW